jgi:cephalosporin-C deacetylase-like acetyl esterase
VFAAFRGLYAYDRTDLNPRIEETESTDAWTREKVTFDAAYGRERVIAHVFLPKRASPPYQPVIFVPGGFAVADDKLNLIELEESLDFVMKGGRALVAPIYKGMYERRDGLSTSGQPQGFYRDHIIMIAKDLRRSVDYLESRRDIDAAKIGYLGVSFGAAQAPVFLAVEPRIKAAMLDSGGFSLRHDPPEVDRINFVPRVRTPVLMLNGRFDTAFPLESAQLPFFRLLGTSAVDKKHVLFDAGHGNFPYREKIREALDWFDKYLGPVQR